MHILLCNNENTQRFHELALLLHLIWGKWYLARQVIIWSDPTTSPVTNRYFFRLSLTLLHVNSTCLDLVSKDTVI